MGGWCLFLIQRAILFGFCPQPFGAQSLYPQILFPCLMTRLVRHTWKMKEWVIDPWYLYLHFSHPNSVFLDSSGVGRYSYLALEPLLTLSVKQGITTIKSAGESRRLFGNPFTHLESTLCGTQITPSLLGGVFAGGLIGYVGYGMNRFVEKLPQNAHDDLGLFDMLFYSPSLVIVHDKKESALTVHSIATTHNDAQDSLKRFILELEHFLHDIAFYQEYDHGLREALSIEDFPVVRTRSSFTRVGYLRAIRRAKQYVLAGDVFQLKLSQRLSCTTKSEPHLIYSLLRLLNPSSYSGFLDADSFHLLSCSPEHLIHSDGLSLATRPIGGTIKKTTGGDQRALRRRFLSDKKEVAEHTMLIDLERNDLGRVSEPGTVTVNELMTIESYSHLHHIVTDIRSQKRTNVTPVQILKAMFPGGTVTGCPKIRSQEIIDELEPTQRGPYTGSLGYFNYEGGLDFNLIIRTLLMKGTKAYAQGGGGIVVDSDPATEYNETLWKVQALFDSVSCANFFLKSPQYRKLYEHLPLRNRLRQ